MEGFPCSCQDAIISPEESTLLQCELTTVKNLRCGKTGLPHRGHFGLTWILQWARFRGVGSVSPATQRVNDICVFSRSNISRFWKKIQGQQSWKASIALLEFPGVRWAISHRWFTNWRLVSSSAGICCEVSRADLALVNPVWNKLGSDWVAKILGQAKHEFSKKRYFGPLLHFKKRCYIQKLWVE